MTGSLSALSGLTKHFQDRIDADRQRLRNETHTRLQIIANRKLGLQDAVQANASAVWPAGTNPPLANEAADGLPILFRKDLLLGSDLKAAMSFATQHHLPLALLIIDIDNFKAFNSDFGHPKADEVLNRIASLVHTVLNGKGRVYRYGGDELCAVAPNFDRDEARSLAERLRRTASEVRVDGIARAITVSIGVAIYPAAGADPETLLGNADAAMYEAKKGGKNRVGVHELPAGS